MSLNLSVFKKIKEKYFHTFNISEIWYVGQVRSVESKYLTILSQDLIENFILLTQMHDPKINNFYLCSLWSVYQKYVLFNFHIFCLIPTMPAQVMLLYSLSD